MGRHSILLVISLCYHLLLVNKVGCTQYPSNDGQLYVEIQTQLLSNKSTTKTVQHGDIAPDGSVLNQRITNTHLIKATQVSENTEVTNHPYNRLHTYFAVARTKSGSGKYSGAGGDLKIQHPEAVQSQYSSNRIRVHAGHDSIEAGWRVDPDLSGYSVTRFYIRTDGIKTHCFNAGSWNCHGFVLKDLKYRLDFPLELSKPGGPYVAMRVFIVRDNSNGNWILQIGANRTVIGYWPRHLFNGLAGMAELVEWGGVVYSPPHTPLPPMGGGALPTGSPFYDGAVSQIRVLNERGQESDPTKIETYADDGTLYNVMDVGTRKEFKDFGHTILFGGPGDKHDD